MPQFGYSSIGSIHTSSADEMVICKANLTEDAFATDVFIYGKAVSGTITMSVAIYDDDGAGYPNNLVTSIERNDITTSLEWKQFTFPTEYSLTTGLYHIGGIGQSNFSFYYNTGAPANNMRVNGDTYGDGFDDPFGSPPDFSLADYLSCYIVYNTGVIINPFQGPNLGADLYNGALIV